MAIMNPNLTIDEKIEELEADIQRISNKFLALGEPSQVAIEEIFKLCAKQLMLISNSKAFPCLNPIKYCAIMINCYMWKPLRLTFA